MNHELAIGSIQSLLERAERVIGIIPCDECSHSLDLHFDRYGCEYDLGDREGDESGVAYARGNCGCKAENLSDDGNSAFLLLRDIRQLRLGSITDSVLKLLSSDTNISEEFRNALPRKGA